MQVGQWKAVLRERMPELSEAGGKQGEDTERLVAELHRKIGELTVDLGHLKKVEAAGTVTERRDLVDEAGRMSVRRQCELLGIARSGLCHECRPETPANLKIMRRLDEMHQERPVCGSRHLTCLLEREGDLVDRKRVMRLLRTMGIEAIYAKARTSEPGTGHQIYPYLPKGLENNGPDLVWCADRVPDISDSDQGAQFTSEVFLEAVESAGTSVSMDGRGHRTDHRMIERLWRSVKYEDVYLRDYADGRELGRDNQNVVKAD